MPAGPPTDVSAAAAGATPPRAATGLALAAVPTAVRCSRMFVNSCLRQWGLPSLSGDSELVVSELVTNAVAATGVTDAEPRWSQLAGLATIHLRVMLFEASIVIAVWDRDLAPPVLRQSEPDSESGRGLSIVAAVCKRWDYLLLDGGKCVWAELAIQPDALTSVELPRRVPASSGVRAAESGTDPCLLRRVHERAEEPVGAPRVYACVSRRHAAVCAASPGSMPQAERH